MLKSIFLVGLALFSTASFADGLRNRDIRLAASDLEMRLMALANAAAHYRDASNTERLVDNAKLEVWNFKQVAGIYDRAQLAAESRGVAGRIASVQRAFGEERLATEKTLSDSLAGVVSAWGALQKKIATADQEAPLPPPHHG